MLKKIAKRMVSPLFLIGRDRHWRTRKVHVLIESLPTFSTKEWLDGFTRYFPDWAGSIEIKFFRNFAEREVLIRETNIYIGAWFSSGLSRNAPELKLVQLVTAGIEFLDDFKDHKKITIVTSSGIASRGVAEHVLMLMLALDRRLDIAMSRQELWHWSQKGIAQNINNLKDRVAGIVGLGNNGRATASLILDLGMKVIGCDLRSDIDIKGVKLCPEGLLELLALADFIILCVPLTSATRRMIGRLELNRMKRNAYLINVSRGEVIDERALAEALKKHVIAGAGLDVLSKEPPPFFHPLRGCPNLIVTPHIAGNIHPYHDAIIKRFILNAQALLNERGLAGVCSPAPGDYQDVDHTGH